MQKNMRCSRSILSSIALNERATGSALCATAASRSVTSAAAARTDAGGSDCKVDSSHARSSSATSSRLQRMLLAVNGVSRMSELALAAFTAFYKSDGHFNF